MKTYSTKASDIQRNWYLVDADGQVLGRLASEVAALLRGKWKRNYVPHLDVGDHIVVINASRVLLTGRKLETKQHFRHTGFHGGVKWTPLSKDMARRPEEVLRKTVWGMLPHTRLGRAMLRKLKVYAGKEHLHAAQSPIAMTPGHHGHYLESVGAKSGDS